MSYTNLMDKQLLLLFKRLKDLTTYATFTKKNKATFNFSTGLPTVTGDAPKTVPIIVIETKKVKSESATVSKTLIGRRADLGDLNDYDLLEFEDAKWKIGTIIKASGPVLMFEVLNNG
jgi:hypothetical protein